MIATFAPKLLLNLNARSRLLIALSLSTLVGVILPQSIRLIARVIATWDVGAISFLALALLIMAFADYKKIRQNARRQDEGRFAIFIFMVAAACTSLLSIAFLLKGTKDLSPILVTLHVVLAIVTVVSSWLLIHTMFALHYAHTYYGNDKETNSEDSKDHAGGLDFPEEKQPDYWDFLYFSFVIGMTAQVSDIQVTSRPMRRLALIHGVLSFFFNTVIVALSINIIAGLL